MVAEENKINVDPTIQRLVLLHVDFAQGTSRAEILEPGISGAFIKTRSGSSIPPVFYSTANLTPEELIQTQETLIALSGRLLRRQLEETQGKPAIISVVVTGVNEPQQKHINALMETEIKAALAYQQSLDAQMEAIEKEEASGNSISEVEQRLKEFRIETWTEQGWVNVVSSAEKPRDEKRNEVALAPFRFSRERHGSAPERVKYNVTFSDAQNLDVKGLVELVEKLTTGAKIQPPSRTHARG